MEANSNTTVISKPKAPRTKLGHLVLTVGVSQPVKFTPRVRVLSAAEMVSVQKRNK